LFFYDIGLVPVKEPYAKRTAHGVILAKGGVKMSKSRPETIINPDTLVSEFGADALRLYEMFIGPFDQTAVWDEQGILGPSRFLERAWRCVTSDMGHGTRDKKNENVERLLHQTIKKVTEDIEAMRFNTAVSALMILLNEMEKPESVSREAAEAFLKLLQPFAPHIAHELWEMLGNKTALDTEPWPAWNPRMLESETVEIVVQVDGKYRDRVTVPKGAGEDEVKKRALASPVIGKWIIGKEVERVIFIPNRLVNLCTKEKGK
jgi:leucyl-tRNA synthetase